MQIMEETEEQVRAMNTSSQSEVAGINRMRSNRVENIKQHSSKLKCKYCGKLHPWRKDLCPAYGKKCIKCGKFNHFASACKSNEQRNHYGTDRNVHRMFQKNEQSNSLEQEDDTFIGDSIRHLQELQISSAQINRVNGSAIGARRHTDGRVVYRDASKFKQIPHDTANPNMNDWRGRVIGAIPDQSIIEPANAPETNNNLVEQNVVERRIQPRRERRPPDRFRDYIIDFNEPQQ
ncbi:uncharacterized protein LOC123529833 [Mercenaria mercenaria]|uniref:uncharacterized protein LOC123529833 n=1 Tax=Mercenaria mercenaria TaxID=6596 RepID=UPI00234EC562|nr:uncharacterized protein LOC123529833 [Mercenaria mercenaria]